MTRKIHLTERMAQKLGLSKPKPKPAREPSTQHDPKGEEYILPGAWSWASADPLPCGECCTEVHLRIREIARAADDHVWRCRPCFEARRKLLRKYGPTPHSTDCTDGS